MSFNHLLVKELLKEWNLINRYKLLENLDIFYLLYMFACLVIWVGREG